jgi:hypothetical protein
MHDMKTNDLVAEFNCYHLSNATNTCAHYRNKLSRNETAKVVRASTHDNEYNRITQVFHREGLPGDAIKPEYIAAHARYYLEKELGQSVLDQPMVCPSQLEVNHILETSLKMERQMFTGRVITAEEETNHRLGMKDFIDKKRFCNVDVNRVVHDPGWKAYMQHCCGKHVRCGKFGRINQVPVCLYEWYASEKNHSEYLVMA